MLPSARHHLFQRPKEWKSEMRRWKYLRKFVLYAFLSGYLEFFDLSVSAVAAAHKWMKSASSHSQLRERASALIFLLTRQLKGAGIFLGAPRSGGGRRHVAAGWGQGTVAAGAAAQVESALHVKHGLLAQNWLTAALQKININLYFLDGNKTFKIILTIMHYNNMICYM